MRGSKAKVLRRLNHDRVNPGRLHGGDPKSEVKHGLVRVLLGKARRPTDPRIWR